MNFQNLDALVIQVSLHQLANQKAFLFLVETIINADGVLADFLGEFAADLAVDVELLEEELLVWVLESTLDVFVVEGFEGELFVSLFLLNFENVGRVALADFGLDFVLLGEEGAGQEDEGVVPF